MDKDKLIELLNYALQFEYNDVFLYPRESRAIKDKDVAVLFENFGLMEIRHADMLAIRILELGGKPAWDFKLLGELSDLKEILKRHLNNEEAAIGFYNNLIERIDDAEIRIVLRGIKAEEEIHRDKIREFLKI
ncbi:ferritin-like domain-containing protein [bacterium]|nr:MAG: ferritin-like domain-containing protein [bacterium]